jgi:hypothetical protein
VSEGKRPGGLTALAVINFVFGGISTLLALGLTAFAALHDRLVEKANEQGNAEAARAWQQLGPGALYSMIALTAGVAFLLIASGVGYLKQKKVLGRGLGNTYAIVSVGSSLVWILMIPHQAGGGFDMTRLIGLIYPVLTLLLINGTFKHDFVR